MSEGDPEGEKEEDAAAAAAPPDLRSAFFVQLFYAWEGDALRLLLQGVHLLLQQDQATPANEAPAPPDAVLPGYLRALSGARYLGRTWTELIGDASNVHRVPDAIATTAEYRTWARTLTLVALWLSLSVRAFFFADHEALRRDLDVRPPARELLPRFLEALQLGMKAFAQRGYRQPELLELSVRRALDFGG